MNHQSKPGLLRRFLIYYRPHKKLFYADMGASLLISLIGMLYPMLTHTVLNDFIPNRLYRFIVIYGAVLFLLYLLRKMLRYFVQYYGHMIGVRMQAHMRMDMFRHLQTLPYTYYDGHETGKIMSRMTNDLMDVSELAHHGPENLIISGIMLVGSFIYLCTIHVPLTLIIFICVPFLVAIGIRLRKKMNDAFTESRKSIALINASLESSIVGIRVTKAFTNAAVEEEKFGASNTHFIDARRDAYKAMAQFHSSTSFITDVFNVVVLIAGGLFLYADQISLADYSAFIVAVNQFINPLTMLIGFMEQYQDGVTGFRRFVEIMDEPSEPESPTAVALTPRAGTIHFEDISFAYDNVHGVLDHLTLQIPAGRKIALVGPSGGGKTTLCHLIPRFYIPTEGRITIDDQNIADVTLASLRRTIGIVQQDVFLFNGSIKDNIRYGRPDATDEEIIEAAQRASIHEYIISLPEGYETNIGERGVRLSGGQKQRLSIARVFLKNPAILILDEATSALDTETEVHIQRALDELCKGRTALIVAHRLSTIQNADEIIVIADGHIQEHGSHAELLQMNGMYRRLYQAQFENVGEAR